MDSNQEQSNNPPQKMVQDTYTGQTIDKYVLLEPLGKGGMGLVYKAQHKRIKRLAALKLLPAQQLSDEVSIKRLEREATAMGNLQHPNIATMYDFGITELGQPYIVLELMKGRNLKEVLKASGSINPGEALPIFIQISDGMAYAHSQALMHRDLKPENIMYLDESQSTLIKILDFGIARHTEESMMLTKTGQIIGSAAYMSPEQCSGKRPVDSRTDIYALGVIMYEMLTGSLPYKGDNFLQTIYLKTTELPSPFPEHLKEIEGLEFFVLKCLAVEPENRPQTMEEVNKSLKDMLVAFENSGGKVTAGPMLMTGQGISTNSTFSNTNSGTVHSAGTSDEDRATLVHPSTPPSPPSQTSQTSQNTPNAQNSTTNAQSTLTSASTPEAPLTTSTSLAPDTDDPKTSLTGLTEDQENETSSHRQDLPVLKNKVILAIALVFCIGLFTMAILELTKGNQTKNTHSRNPENSKGTKTIDSVEAVDSIKEDKLKPKGSSLGADVLMGGKATETMSPETQLQAKTKPKITNPEKDTTKRRTTHKQTDKTMPPVAPSPSRSTTNHAPYQAPIPATPPVVSTPAPVPLPQTTAPTGSPSHTNVKEPAYYVKQYNKAKRTGKKLDQKLRHFLKKF